MLVARLHKPPSAKKLGRYLFSIGRVNTNGIWSRRSTNSTFTKVPTSLEGERRCVRLGEGYCPESRVETKPSHARVRAMPVDYRMFWDRYERWCNICKRHDWTPNL